jgi:hypothetical protein
MLEIRCGERLDLLAVRAHLVLQGGCARYVEARVGHGGDERAAHEHALVTAAVFALANPAVFVSFGPHHVRHQRDIQQFGEKRRSGRAAALRPGAAAEHDVGAAQMSEGGSQ